MHCQTIQRDQYGMTGQHALGKVADMENGKQFNLIENRGIFMEHGPMAEFSCAT